MTDIYCRLCLKDCSNGNGISLYDNEIDVDLPQLIAKYLLIVVERTENTLTQLSDGNMCRMCFVHLLDFHYFFMFIERKQRQQKLLLLDQKLETISLSGSETEVEEESFVDNSIDVKTERYGYNFHVINEADDRSSILQTESSPNVNIFDLDTMESEVDVKIKFIGDKLAPDPVSLENKFIYDDDSELEITGSYDFETNRESNKNEVVKLRKHKLNRNGASWQKSSIKDNKRLRRKKRRNNEYNLVDKNLCSKATSADIFNRSGTQSENLAKKPRTRVLTSEINATSDPLKSDNSDETKSRPEAEKRSKNRRNDVLTSGIIATLGPLECDICKIRLDTFRDLTKHFRRKHSKRSRPYVLCCEKRHYSPKVLANHILSHSNPELFKCEVCNKVLGTHYSYLQHKRFKHSGKRQAFKCNICGKRLISAKYFDVHVANHY